MLFTFPYLLSILHKRTRPGKQVELGGFGRDGSGLEQVSGQKGLLLKIVILKLLYNLEVLTFWFSAPVTRDHASVYEC
ncbi:hypothetical protein HanXRQr2_Chr13g0566741 [Helianthus annuus]|uniref:Uncharacterized protein n=1 Tax=Helianthus annuus TaxID=4232 RepID=A0A9K3EDI0_HELAN|nr:hypothetical protein HanXRQr2_Chr13g0566741 [Helianthus annuus]KAJ0847478.1 hypothetical protein HanPSC8_Chr13g0545781 [Helianthus annuus]